MPSLRRTVPLAAIAALAAVLLACAAPFVIPPNSRPLQQSQPYAVPNFSSLLPGTWTLVSELAATDTQNVLPNVIDRQAELAGIHRWDTFRFTRDGLLHLASGKHTATLVWAVNQNRLTLHLKGATESDHWQIISSGRDLFLRSLSDSDTFTLRREQ